MDVGCSQGITCLLLGREGFDCTGVDIEEPAIERARKDLDKEDAAVRERVRFQLADAKCLPFEDNSFDSVLLCEILEHLNHPEKVLTEAQRVLKDKGKVIITVPYGLLAHPDHKQTFYPVSLLETLQPFFRTTLIDVLHNKQLVYSGVKDTAYRLEDLTEDYLLATYRLWARKLEERCTSVELSLTETNERLGEQLKSLRAQLSEREEKAKAQTERLTAKDAEIAKLTQALEQTRSLIVSVKEGAIRVEAESAAQAHKVKELQEQLEAKEEQLRHLKTATEQQRASVTGLKEKLFRAEAELSAQASKAKELQESLALREEKVANLESAIEKQRAALTGAGEQLVRAEAESATQATRAKELRDTVTARDSRIRELETTLEEVRASLASQTQRSIRAEVESTTQASNNKELEARLVAKESQIRELEANLEQARASIVEFREGRIRGQTESAAQRKKLRALERTLAAKDCQVRDLEKVLGQERECGAALRKQVTEVEATRARLNAEAVSAKEALKPLQTRITALEAENTKVKEDLKARNAAGQQQLARLEALQTARLREREREQSDLLSKVEADWKRKLTNERIREVVRLSLPPAARVLVVSKGDDDLLRLDGRCGMHFPQTEGGVYAGYHPADSAEAIKHLEVLKPQAEFLLIPASSFWWLDYYADFRRYLESHYQLVVYSQASCVIFALGGKPSEPLSGLTLSFNTPPKTRPQPGENTQTSKPAVLKPAPDAKQQATLPVPAELNRVRLAGVLQPPPTKLPPDLKVACVLDEFTEACFYPEWKALTFRPDNWKTTLESAPADLLFVESAWKGNQGSWQYKVVSVTKGRELEDLVFHCRAKGIPTAFWNKEDPVHFDRFIKSASLFDYVFTTDGDCIPRYREHLQHNRIFPLPFAAQPRIHNPILQTERLHNVCFAGAYYGASHDERRKDMDLILKPSLEFGLHIFDRQHGLVGTAAEQYRYPDIYQSAVKGYLPYDQMVKAYKRYKVFLNVNSVKRSPTMFSRRIFELLASGTPVISAYAKGIENLLGTDLVLFSESEQQTKQLLERLLADELEWARLSMRGIRAVFERHTYSHRCHELCSHIDSAFPLRPLPKITVIAKAGSVGDVEHLAATLGKQTYRYFDVALFQGKGLKDSQLEPLRNAFKDIQVQVFPNSAKLLETCMGLKTGDYLWFLNPVDFYGANFLKDCALATTYSNAEFIGKHTHFVLAKDLASADLSSHGYEFRLVDSVAPGSLIVKRGSLSAKEWEVWLAQRTVSPGKQRTLSIDRFNYIRNAFPPQRNGSSRDEHFFKSIEV